MRGELLCRLLVGSEVAIAPDVGPEHGLEDRLERAIAAARAAWPRATVSDDDFVQHLAAALRRGAARSVDDWFARDTVSDLYLACGCALGDAEALLAFDAHYIAGLDAALRRFDLPAAVVDDVKQDVRQRLLVGDGSRPPRIAEFTGAGSLRGWLSIVALNAARQILRRGKPAPASEDLLDAIPCTANDAELELLKAHYRDHFRAAFTAALGELSPRDRTLLRQHYLLGVGVGRIATMYGVHRGTATRWLERCNRKLLSTTRRLLASRLRIDRNGVDSILRLVRSRLDISIRTALAPET